MNAFPFVTLGDAVQVNPGLPRNVRPGENTPISFVPMAAVCEKAGSIASPEVRPFREVSQGFTLFADNDVLFAKITPCMENGKAAIARNLVNGQGAGSTEFFVLRPSPFVLPEFVYYFVRRGSFRASCKAHFSGSAGQRRVPRSYLEKVLFPLPPLEEQRRVVGLLDRAAEIRRRAEAARAKARTIIPALFLDTFGDPATNPKGWPTARLGALAKLTGGGTPSKANAAFWGGTIPWVSPKDMKPPTIFGSEDKITEAAMAASPVSLIPAGNVLIVVRGMILAHTVPIRMNGVAVTLNQDMKAIIPIDGITAVFLRWALQSLHGYLLSKVRELAHGTKKLETAVLTDQELMVPPPALQTDFAEKVRRIEALAHALDAAAAKAEAMAASLSAEVFGA